MIKTIGSSQVYFEDSWHLFAVMGLHVARLATLKCKCCVLKLKKSIRDAKKTTNAYLHNLACKGFYHIWAWWPSWSCDQHRVISFSFPFIQNLVQIGTVVAEKSSLNFCMYTTLGQGQEMTLTFNTHISSFRCLLLLPFRSLAAIVSEKSTVFTFSYRKD